jgi:hypothetical protein
VTIQIRYDAPLEELLKDRATTNGSAFPNRGINYFDRYIQIKQHLAGKYYQATGSGLGSGGQRFTKHDITHVDDVIHRAGQLIGAGAGPNAPCAKLVPYEIFALLYAIVVHDAGNAYARAGHEARAFQIIRDMGELSALETVERQLIASLAQAHGGRTEDGDRDTIPTTVKEEVSGLDGICVHGRRIAAIVRLADELSEHPRRADEIALQPPYNPRQSFLPNFYCKIINTNIDYLSGDVFIKYMIDKANLRETFPDPESDGAETLVVDYIAKRLNKCDLERRYCNRFPNGFAVVWYMRAALQIYDENSLIEEVPVDLSDTGYPVTERGVKDREPRFDGEALKQAHLGDQGETGGTA